jgi:hypothetical protein
MNYTDCLEIGPAPSDEDCVQVGEEDYGRRAMDECKRFIELIREKVGVEPAGARLYVKANPHDFGTYFEVAVRFDRCLDAAVDYAFRVERDAPSRWS